MALDFPANPTDGQVFGTYIWSASKSVWQAKPQSATVATTSSAKPTTPNNGDIWIDTSDGIAYFYYDDGTSTQWVEVMSSGVPSLASKADLTYVNSQDALKANIASPTFTGTVNLGTATANSFFVSRQNSASEGGQLDLARSVDNATGWYVDVYGNTSTPELRFVNTVSPYVQGKIDSSGSLYINGDLRNSDGVNKIGLVPLKPTSIGVGGGGSASFNATTGAITFTNTSIVQPNGVFTSAYKYYRVVSRFVADADRGYAWRLASGGSWNTNLYYHFVLQWNGGSGYGSSPANSQSLIGYSLGHKYAAVSMDFINPAVSGSVKHMTGHYSGLNSATTSNESHSVGATFRDVNYVADGFSLFPSAGTFSGDMTVYGYN